LLAKSSFFEETAPLTVIIIYMVKERVEQQEEHLRRLQLVDLTIPPPAVDLLSRVIGQDVTKPPTQAQMEGSQAWIHSEGKQRVSRALGRVVGLMGGRALMTLTAKAVERHDGQRGYFTCEVGFLGSSGLRCWSRTKIRTMKPDAADLLSSPFDHTSFQAGIYPEKDKRILPIALARVLRRTAGDELPQAVLDIPRGDSDLVGARGYTVPELEGTAILIALRDDPELNLDPEVREFLAAYPEKVDYYRPRPALFSPQSATLFKDSPHVFRMFSDVVYWERASPVVDFRLIFYTFVRRLQGVGAR
jgi:lipopolysaccharide/colanic/teichoic acid biosynthesis glycosyltransferase